MPNSIKMSDVFCNSGRRSPPYHQMAKGTISISFVEEALLEAGKRGFESSALLVQSGVNPGWLNKPQARVSPEQYGAIWHVLASTLDDEFFGMDSHPMRYGSFAMLCHAVLDCTSLGHALDRAARFLSLVLDDVRGAVVTDKKSAQLQLHDRQDNPRDFAHGTLIVILYGLACWLTGRRLVIQEVSFVQCCPENLAEYHLVFGQNIQFSQSQSALFLESRALSLPIIRDGRALTEFLRKAPANFLVKYRNEGGYVARIRKALSATPFDQWPIFGDLAARLRTTESTLRRRLESEGSSFQAVKDDLRRDQAINLLCNTVIPVEDIALELGFKENSAFYRAFKKWTGLSPGSYRTTRVQRLESSR
ncbi:MAG: AraC family transcriptional regulator [Azoarcus sp.]|nr:AraC family transcriptional regulator [Azoarcus sp.]